MSDSSDKPVNLSDLRQAIDSIDSQIHELLNRRARCAQQVAEVKLREFEEAQKFESGEGNSSAQQLLFYRPEREAQVLARVKAANQGPLADDTVAVFDPEGGPHGLGFIRGTREPPNENLQ